MLPSRTQLYHHLCISNALINTHKSSIQTKDKHKYSLNTTRLITTSDTQLILIVQQSCQQMGSRGIIKPNITACHRSNYQCQRTGNQNCKNRNGEYRTLNLQWRNSQLAGNVNQILNNTNSTISNNKTNIEKVAQLDGKNYTYSLPADPQLPNTIQDYQQNTQPMIVTPNVTNTIKEPFLGATWQSENTDNNHRINKYTECKREFRISQKSTEHL